MIAVIYLSLRGGLEKYYHNYIYFENRSIYRFNIRALLLRFYSLAALDICFKFKVQFWSVWPCDGFFSTCIAGVSRFSIGFSFWNDSVLDPRVWPALFFRSRRLFRSRNKQCPPSRLRERFKITRPSRVCPRFVPHFCENYRMPFEHHMFWYRLQFDEDVIKLIICAR